MKVLLTGGAGYLGSVVTRELLVHGHEVRVLDCLLYGEKGLSELWTNDRLQFSRGDIRSLESIEAALEGIEAVVHLAALVGDPACARRPDLARRTNQEASLRLFEQSHRRGIHRFLFASTCSNYGRMSNPTEHLTEESPLQPISLYAKTKVAVEQALLGSGTSNGTSVTVLRFATLYGLSPRMRFDLTVNILTNHAVNRGVITVFGGSQQRPNIHIDDVAELYVQLLEFPDALVAGETFNAGYQNHTVADLALLVRRVVEQEMPEKTPIRIETRSSNDLRSYHVSCKKIAQRLGYTPKRTIEDAVRDLCRAFREGRLPNSLSDERYINVSMLKKLASTLLKGTEVVA